MRRLLLAMTVALTAPATHAFAQVPLPPTAPPTGPTTQRAPAAPATDEPAAPPTSFTVGPPVQRIESASALSTEQLGSVTSVRELPDGRVLVNDGTRRRLLLMDTTLTVAEVVLDSLSEIANTYGTRPGALVPFRGDTTLFIDPASFAIVVLDAEGRIARIRSVWRVQDAAYFASSSGLYGYPGLDAQGRIVYRVPARPAPPASPPPMGMPYFPPQPDSAFIVAADLDTRRIDTLGVVRIPKSMSSVRQIGNLFVFDNIVNPLPATDHWAVLHDGTVAFIRGQDYRIEYLHADGSTSSSGKLPYDWQRLTDDDKEVLLDSVRIAQQRIALNEYTSFMIMWTNQFNKPYPPDFTVPDGYVPQPGFAQDWIMPPGVQFPPNYIYACAPGVEPTMAAPPTPPAAAAVTVTAPPGPPAPAVATGPPAGMPSCVPLRMFGSVQDLPRLRQVSVVSAADLPDYRPPFITGSPGAVRADFEGNLWIRTVPPRPIPGGFIYDIVNRDGELVNRIQLPPGHNLIGFGRNKVVYLWTRQPTGVHLARVRLR
ncbi:hypothetical protein BH23GEM9_BH23GEM9_31680 [soil metagenome]